MDTNQSPLLTIVIYGGDLRQKKEMAERIAGLCPAKDKYDLVIIHNKKDIKNCEIDININVSIKVIDMKKNRNSINQIGAKALKECGSNHFIFQDINEELYDINKFVEVIQKNSFSNQNIVAFTSSVRRKDNYLIEDAPMLFINKNLSNIAIPRSILVKSIGSVNQYEWKINTILNSEYVSIIPLEIENLRYESISMFFQSTEEQIKKLSNLLNQIKLNKYIKYYIIKNLYELIVTTHIGPIFKDIIYGKNSTQQVLFLKEFEKWLKKIDLNFLSYIPAIRYFFIRWSIDHYNSFSYTAKRQHIKILKYIINNMHFDSHQIFIKKYNKMFPAAMTAVKLNSIIPIYKYLLKRRLKTLIKHNKIIDFSKQHSGKLSNY
ncbi:hypothetical protein [Bacillus salipaludis]|uniref:hypothetical protein n=1 Tax=Bacillus salipaludis TaxID=2547811 RepID=UPI002E1B22CF|nr:hypothetical protein [Bacillus salipaludis]